MTLGRHSYANEVIDHSGKWHDRSVNGSTEPTATLRKELLKDRSPIK